MHARVASLKSVGPSAPWCCTPISDVVDVGPQRRGRLVCLYIYIYFGLGGIPSYTREYGSFWLCGVISGAETELFH